MLKTYKQVRWGKLELGPRTKFGHPSSSLKKLWQKVKEIKEIKFVCKQLFYRKHLPFSAERKKPLTSRHTLIWTLPFPYHSAGRRVCHWDPTQVIRILFKYVFTEPTHTSHSYSQAQEFTDHLPYSAFPVTHLTLIHILFCSPWVVFCLFAESRTADENFMAQKLLVTFL